MPEFRVGGVPPEQTFQSIALDVGQSERTMASLLRAINNLERQGNQRDAARVRELHAYYNQRIRSIAIATGDIFEEGAKAHLNATQRRPDSGRGSAKLVDLIKAVAWEPNPLFSFGWVSMGIHEELDKAVNPYTGGVYWRAQEWGYQYTHTPTGFFLAGPGYGGATSRPNAAQAGVHPLFIARKSGGKFRSPPRIRARHFLSTGARDAVAHWRSEMRRFDHDFARRSARLMEVILRDAAR